MGQAPAELEAEVRRKRAALDARVARLDQRVREDIDLVRTRSADRVQDMKDAATSAGEDAAHKAGSIVGTRAGSDTTVAQHPGMLLAGSAAAGFALGLKSGSNGHDDRARRPGSERPGLVAMLADSVRDVIEAETGALVDAALDTATSGLKSVVMAGTGAKVSDAVSGDGHERPNTVKPSLQADRAASALSPEADVSRATRI